MLLLLQFQKEKCVAAVPLRTSAPSAVKAIAIRRSLAVMGMHGTFDVVRSCTTRRTRERGAARRRRGGVRGCDHRAPSRPGSRALRRTLPRCGADRRCVGALRALGGPRARAARGALSQGVRAAGAGAGAESSLGGV